jgi:hypothetical protein
MQDEVRYPPQRGLSCCPCCILYCLAVLSDTTVTLCPRDVMDAILDVAWETYETVRARSGHTLLQQHEVLAALRLPPSIAIREIYGTAQRELASTDARSVYIGDLHGFLRNQSALVLTALDHTTCLVRAHGDLVAFDPLVAAVTRLRGAEDVQRYVAQKYPGCKEMTISQIVVAGRF